MRRPSTTRGRSLHGFAPAAADLSAGNREILQTLALEASTILENARLLEEERAKQHLEEELDLARTIQQGLLPSKPALGGLVSRRGIQHRLAPCRRRLFDVRTVSARRFRVCDRRCIRQGRERGVAGRVAARCVLFASEGNSQIEDVMSSINRFLLERAKGEKYATVFYCTWTAGESCAGPTPAIRSPSWCARNRRTDLA